MGVRVLRFQATPNPNALKCLLDRAVSDVPRSYFSADEAGGDDLARALFAIPGVTNLLINDDWATVSKRDDADWPPIKKQVEQVFASLPGGSDDA